MTSNILYFVSIYTGAQIARTGEEAKPFEAKWTLTKEGQKKYGGWKDGAYSAYDSYYDAPRKRQTE